MFRDLGKELTQAETRTSTPADRGLEDALRRLANDYGEVAEDIEAGATEPRHPDLIDGGSPRS